MSGQNLDKYILTGYRKPDSSFIECLSSAFHINNETFNIWTHIAAAAYFIYLAFDLSKTHDFLNDGYFTPLALFIFGTCLVFLTSGLAHTFSALSARARHICFFFDYTALSIVTMGVSVAYKAYIFPSNMIGGLYYHTFLPMAAINAILSIAIISESRFMEPSITRQTIRIIAYAIPFFFDSLPMIHRMRTCSGIQCDARSLSPHSTQYVFALSAAFVYILHVPERFFPTTFDIVGQSHQIFHICTATASHFQLQGLLMDIKDRRSELQALKADAIASEAIILMSLVIIGDALVLAYYINRLKNAKPTDRCWKYLYGNTNNTSPQKPNKRGLNVNGKFTEKVKKS